MFLFDFSFFDFFSQQDFLIKPLQFTVNSFRRRLACESGDRLCANPIIYYVSGTLFSRRRLWGGLKCLTVVRFTFRKKMFSFLASFFVLTFWVAQCGGFISNNSIWEPPGRIYRPHWEGLRDVFLLANPLFYLRNLMFFFLTINFPMRI